LSCLAAPLTCDQLTQSAKINDVTKPTARVWTSSHVIHGNRKVYAFDRVHKSIKVCL
jgi:hypothetical protein